MSYDPTLTEDRDKVRALVGDTSGDASTEHLADGVYDWLLTVYPSVFRAAAAAARSIASKFAAKASRKVVGSLQLEYQRNAEHFLAVADDLEAQATAAAAPIPYAGGISKSEKRADKQDTDLVQPRFYRGQFAAPGTGFSRAELIDDEDG